MQPEPRRSASQLQSMSPASPSKMTQVSNCSVDILAEAGIEPGSPVSQASALSTEFHSFLSNEKAVYAGRSLTEIMLTSYIGTGESS